MNKSKQRDAILTVLRSTQSHPTAEWILDKARELVPGISLGTVYRNLDKLILAGEVIKVQGTFDKDRYDGNAQRHAHFVCEQCGRVLDIDVQHSVDNQIMAQDTECVVNNYNLIYNGLCPLCK